MFRYDKETGLLTWKSRSFESSLASGWNKRYAEKLAGVKNLEGYISVSINGSRYLAHRIIWKMLHNTEPSIVDHIDRNKENNKEKNLREASESLSQFNKILPKGRLPRGVQPNKNQFMARLKGKYLGSFKTPEEAYFVYCESAKKAFNSFPTAAFPNE